MLRLASSVWDEKRQARRFTVEALSDIRLAPRRGPAGLFTGRPRITGKIHDASATGLQVLSDRPFRTGDAVVVWFDATDGHEVMRFKLVGDVAWTRRPDPTGRCMLGINLRARPRGAMAAWQETAFERIRNIGDR